MNELALLTGKDAFLMGLEITVAGLLIVFSVLVLIWGILSLFGKVFSGIKKTEKPQEAVQKAVVPETPEIAAPEANEEEIVAAITAAISACLGQSQDRFVVRSFKRIAKKSK